VLVFDDPPVALSVATGDWTREGLPPPPHALNNETITSQKTTLFIC